MRALVLLTAVVALLVLGAESRGQDTNLSCIDVVPPSDSGSGRIGDVAEGRDGRLAWTDGRPGQFLLRDRNGTVRVVGRSGAGPGEFDRPIQFVWKADTIMVSDWRLRRVQAFSDTGRLIRTMTALVPGEWAARPDDRLVMIRPISLADERSLPFVVVSQRPGELKLDTIAEFVNPSVGRFERVVGNRVVRNHQPFEAAAFASGTADGSRFCGVTPVENGTVLRCVDASGREVAKRDLVLQSRPLTDAIYDSTVRAHMVGGSREADLRSKIRRPRSLPPVLGMMMNNTGEIWLQRSHRTESMSVWARIRTDGSIRDEILLPRRYRIIKADGEFIWVATADPDGLETLHRCRIVR